MLEQLKMIIMDTISALHSNTAEQPDFQFHRGANLLVIIGSRDAVDVARKVVSALPGQAHLPQPQVSTSENERFRQRYGLMPNNPPGQGETIGRNPAEMDAFRKRYGLDGRPAPEPGAAPAQKPPP